MDEHFVIEAQLVDVAGATLKLDHVVVDAVLYVGGRTRYCFQAGVTDASGRISVTFEQLEKIRLGLKAFAIMDYNTRLQDCDPVVDLLVPSATELQRRHAGIMRRFPDNVAELDELANSTNGRIVCERVRVDVGTSETGMVRLVCDVVWNGKAV